ncbi:MAG: hypothetical protein HY814_03685 [Candidatus Riflebacteria bacterium]|nr:hypothetical protein [Candidatus Riflebacteria bacterium]
MRRLIALHAFGLSVCCGLLGLQLALEQIAGPAQAARPFARSAPLAASPRIERSCLEALALHRSALALERRGAPRASVTAAFQRSRSALAAALVAGPSARLRTDAMAALGESYLHGNPSPTMAERWSRQALKLDPRHFEALRALARALGLQKREAEEAATWERALAVCPDSPDLHKRAALAYFASTLPDSLERAYDHAVAAVQLDDSLVDDLDCVLDAGEGSLADVSPDLGPGRETDLAAIIDRGQGGKLSEPEAERYTRELGRMLQGQN